MPQCRLLKWIRGRSRSVAAGVAPLLVLATAVLACAPEPVFPPPETRREPVTDIVHGVEIVDEYRWLEDQDADETRAWIDAQNAHAEEVLAEAAEFREEFRWRLTELMDVAEAGSPRAAGEHQIFTLRRAGEPVGRIVRRPKPDGEEADEPVDPEGEYEVVVDPLEIHGDGTTSVEIRSVSPSGRYLLYAVRDGGQDEVRLRIRDLESGVELDDRLPNALYGSSWLWSTDESAFLYVRRSRQSGPRARIHRLGTPVTMDEEVLGEGIPPTAFLSVSRMDEDSRLLVEVQHGWARQDIYLADVADDGVTPASPLVTVVEDVDAQFDVRFLDGRLWIRTSHEAPNYRLVEADPDSPGIDSWRTVIPESEQPLRDLALIDGRLYVTYLDDVASRILVFEPDGTAVDELELPPRASARIAADGEATARITVESFLQPETIYEVDLEGGERRVWKAPEEPFDAGDIAVGQRWATSADGTRVPYFVVHRGGLELDGDRPTLLYGYGGFNAALQPRFSPLAVAWVEAGGVYAQANLRGGSEFGEDWHRDGWLGSKQHVFDDFIAVAEDLVEHGYTRPARLAIRGVSNGGLLMGAVTTQRPDLFRAVYIGFPDLDMVRFHTFEATNNKPALLEYGDASDRGQFEFLRDYSPYQAVTDGTDYPAVMIATGDLDTRVPPLQGRKMAARLQAATASPHPVILRYDPRAGHAGGRTVQKRIDDTAAELAFAWWQLGGGRWWDGVGHPGPGRAGREDGPDSGG